MSSSSSWWEGGGVETPSPVCGSYAVAWVRVELLGLACIFFLLVEIQS